jgi:hypothetical protein
MRALALVCLAACAVPIVPTDRAHIAWVSHGRHGHYEKLDTPLEGTTCGEQYMRAVTGVPQAEDLMRDCYRDNMIYGAGMLGFVAFPVAGLITSSETSDSARPAILGTGLGLGVASFAVGFIAAIYSSYRLSDAVGVYNMSVDRGLEQAPVH